LKQTKGGVLPTFKKKFGNNKGGSVTNLQKKMKQAKGGVLPTFKKKFGNNKGGSITNFQIFFGNNKGGSWSDRLVNCHDFGDRWRRAYEIMLHSGCLLAVASV
jgi:hypothetical protein